MELFGSCQALISGLVESLGMLRANKRRRRLSCSLPHFLYSLPSHDPHWLPPPWSMNSLEFPAYLFLLLQTRNCRHLWQRHFRSPIGSPNPRIYKVPSNPCVCVCVCVPVTLTQVDHAIPIWDTDYVADSKPLQK